MVAPTVQDRAHIATNFNALVTAQAGSSKVPRRLRLVSATALRNATPIRVHRLALLYLTTPLRIVAFSKAVSTLKSSPAISSKELNVRTAGSSQQPLPQSVRQTTTGLRTRPSIPQAAHFSFLTARLSTPTRSTLNPLRHRSSRTMLASLTTRALRL